VTLGNKKRKRKKYWAEASRASRENKKKIIVRQGFKRKLLLTVGGGLIEKTKRTKKPVVETNVWGKTGAQSKMSTGKNTKKKKKATEKG